MTRWMLLALALLACKDRDSDSAEIPHHIEQHGKLTVETWSDQTDGDGLLSVTVNIGDAAGAFMVTGQSIEPVAFNQVIDPSGNVVLDYRDWLGDRDLTGAVDGAVDVGSLNWPVRAVDGPLESGAWTVILATVDNDETRAPAPDLFVDVGVYTKIDQGFSNAEVGVRIAYADGVDSDPDVVAAVEGAVEHWRSLWAPHGLTIRETYHDTDVDPRLPFATYGGSEIEALAESIGEPGELLMVIGEEAIDRPGIFGTSAGTPGTLMPSKFTYVIVPWRIHAGVDAEFSPFEIELMGTTMAHEISHYMGLPHVVTQSWDRWDALSDTPQCASELECESMLRTNLMFPYGCTTEGCLLPSELTPEQVGVLHRYVGAL